MTYNRTRQPALSTIFNQPASTWWLKKNQAAKVFDRRIAAQSPRLSLSEKRERADKHVRNKITEIQVEQPQAHIKQQMHIHFTHMLLTSSYLW